jgi:predicted transcriptional regulator
MDAVYRQGRASVAEVLEQIPDPPSYSAVRTMMGILESKGHLTHTKEGIRFIYFPTRPRRAAGQAALRRVLETFYQGSAEKVVAALLDAEASKLSPEELARLADLVEEARREGR